MVGQLVETSCQRVITGASKTKAVRLWYEVLTKNKGHYKEGSTLGRTS